MFRWEGIPTLDAATKSYQMKNGSSNKAHLIMLLQNLPGISESRKPWLLDISSNNFFPNTVLNYGRDIWRGYILNMVKLFLFFIYYLFFFLQNMSDIYQICKEMVEGVTKETEKPWKWKLYTRSKIINQEPQIYTSMGYLVYKYTIWQHWLWDA